MSRLQRHLIPEFGRDLITSITAERIERFLLAKQHELGTWSIEHLRRQLRSIFTCALTFKRLRGTNPVAAVRARKIAQKRVTYLEADEIPRLLAALASWWRPLFATAVYAGLRKGELAGLDWSDVDLERRLITVARSYDADGTKTGKVRSDTCPSAMSYCRTSSMQPRIDAWSWCFRQETAR